MHGNLVCSYQLQESCLQLPAPAGSCRWPPADPGLYLWPSTRRPLRDRESPPPTNPQPHPGRILPLSICQQIQDRGSPCSTTPQRPRRRIQRPSTRRLLQCLTRPPSTRRPLRDRTRPPPTQQHPLPRNSGLGSSRTCQLPFYYLGRLPGISRQDRLGRDVRPSRITPLGSTRRRRRRDPTPGPAGGHRVGRWVFPPERAEFGRCDRKCPVVRPPLRCRRSDDVAGRYLPYCAGVWRPYTYCTDRRDIPRSWPAYGDSFRACFCQGV